MEATLTQTVHLGVGIDTARYGHHVSFMNAQREIVSPPLEISESTAGYEKLAKRLQQLSRKYPNVHFHVRMDAAGQYALNLERFLRGIDLPITLSIGEPKRNKDYHRAISPKLKSDASESLAMARFAVVERPPTTPQTPEQIQALREIAGRLESQVKTCTQAINRFHNLLSRVFPELALIATNIAAYWVLALLDKYPTPARIARAAMQSLAGIPRLRPDKAKKIHDAAKETIASLGGEVAETLVRQAVADIKHAQRGQQTLEKLLSQAFEALPASGHLQVATIPGIGAVTAAVLVAKIVSIGRFETAEHLVGYFGIFPEEYSSGVDRQGNPRRKSKHMSRKGNDLVRRYLFCAAKSAIVHNPAVKSLYARLRARGTRGDVALGHCMRKLLHQVFVVWTTNKPFDKNLRNWERTAEKSENSSEAQQKAAGLKREVIPVRKEVTAASSIIDDTSNSDNPPDDTLSARKEKNGGSVDYAYLRSQITIEQVLRKMGKFDGLRGTTQLRGPCPFHQSDNTHSTSFSVNLKKNVFRCCHPQCGVHGNAFDLWAIHTNQAIYPAAVSLSAAFNIPINGHREEATRNSQNAKKLQPTNLTQ